MSISLSTIRNACREAVVKASTCFEPEKIKAWQKAIESETEENSKWVLEQMVENSAVADRTKRPLCNDTGIPYVLIEMGKEAELDGNTAQFISATEQGVADGLRELPGRPMAVKGNEFERITQEQGLYTDPAMVLPSPVRFSAVEGKKVRITVMLQGGGPEIRGRTYRVFHHHDFKRFSLEVADWAVEMAKLLGCTPCVPAIGVGRTHYEATCLMMDALAHGKFGEQNEFEKTITDRVNESFTGPLGIGGKVTAVQTFAKIGPQRASGVRIVSLRVGCMVDPRRCTIEI